MGKDPKLWGKSHLVDRNVDTCWNSEQGPVQWIDLTFKSLINFVSISFVFQGGFVGRDVSLQGFVDDVMSGECVKVYPDDVNSKQSFSCVGLEGTRVRITFNGSSDFYGRVVIYDLDLNVITNE